MQNAIEEELDDNLTDQHARVNYAKHGDWIPGDSSRPSEPFLDASFPEICDLDNHTIMAEAFGRIAAIWWNFFNGQYTTTRFST